jgi:alkanesulfonate monooxygenase SsuD/methylene tetrahydromethanopterin reductase-like flavin-dependent oxidoreductase (luciferase family)
LVALSILEVARVTENTDARAALDNARDLAGHAESLGYRRFWVAEHHNMAGIASAATSVVIAHIAAGTRSIPCPDCHRRTVWHARTAVS